MGNEQSNKSNKGQEAKMSPAEVHRLLEQQRRMYERKCQEAVEKATAAQEEQRTRVSPPQPSAPPSTVYVAQPVYIQQPAAPQHVPVPQPAAYMPAHANFTSQGAATVGFNAERQRTPYSYAREDLQNVTRAVPPANRNIYPNLNNQGASTSANTHEFSFTQPNTQNNNNQNSAHSFVFVNRNGQAERPRPSAPAMSRTNRDRSISRSRNNHDGNELNCPTCRTTYGLQIYQCNRGHSSCNTCKQNQRQCGICGNAITDLRNFTLEGYIAEQKVPCPNNNEGCMLVIKMLDMDIHIKECPFKELQCPVGCSWRGKLKQLTSHFDSSHPQQSAEVGSEMRLQDVNSSQKVYLVVIGAFNFLFHVKACPNRGVFMTTQLIGTKISASKWSYEVQVYNKNAPRRKYTFSDVCFSFIEPVADIFNESKCSVLPPTYLASFTNNGGLNFKFFIKKTVENRPRGEFGKNQRGKGRK